MSHKPLWTIFLRLFLPLAVFVLVGTYLYGQAEIERDLSRLKAQETLNIGLGAGALSRNLGATIRDLKFLASHSALHAAVDAPTQKNLQHLAEDFVTFSQANGTYAQLRWIDETGMETVRVDDVKGLAEVIPSDKLQNKGQRYFFTDTFKLKPGEVFVSPLDLNVEQDKIEVPYKPMLRVATPVTNSQSAKRGIVILNFNGQVMLDSFAAAAPTTADHSMILNNEGYWLKSPKAADEWGFMFKRTDLSLAVQAPLRWAEIRSMDSGQKILADGLWTWQTVYPLDAGVKSSTGTAEAFAPSRGEVERKQYFWKAVAHLPADVLSATRQATLLKLAGVSTLLLGLLGFGSWRLAIAWVKRAEAEEAVRRLNAGLEQQIDSRTRELRIKVAELDEEIVERKRADATVERERVRLQTILKTASDGIHILDSEGVLVEANEAFLKMVGYDDSLIGKKWITDWDTPGSGAVINARNADLIERRAHAIFESRHRRRDGSIVEVEINAVGIEIAGKGYLYAASRDITERKQTERELKNQREHLEELVDLRTIELTQALEVAKVADQTKDAFLANMSHELRTPLSAVIGIANLAQGVSTEPKLRDYLDKIVRSGKHLNRIINELLDLSKIAAGRMELEVIPFSLRSVIAHVESVMSHRAAEKGLAIVMAIDDAVPDVLLGDPTRFAQIFLNLIGNALKFTHAGRVAVRVSLRACEESRIFLDIEVEDTGIGMRPEDLEQLFLPFSQADATVSRKYGGTGLGLTISRRLAEMMDGDISVTSVEGRGTTFKVRLWLGLGDAADLPLVEPSIDEALPKRYQDTRILVADDQALNREIVEALLAGVGITPRLATNGQEVLDILTESGPDAYDLVLMDIQMPVMDGLTATRALRNLAGFENLPIIAMTAHTMAHEQELNAAAGMNDHIGKPFDNASFYRTLSKWVSKDKQRLASASEDAPQQTDFRTLDVHNFFALQGVDVVAAISRFGGREDRYVYWLKEFVATAGAIPDQLRSEIVAGQMDTAAKVAHAFKGRVGMLGMADLHRIVSALESALLKRTPADEILSRLEQAIAQMRDHVIRTLASLK